MIDNIWLSTTEGLFAYQWSFQTNFCEISYADKSDKYRQSMAENRHGRFFKNEKKNNYLFRLLYKFMKSSRQILSNGRKVPGANRFTPKLRNNSERNPHVLLVQRRRRARVPRKTPVESECRVRHGFEKVIIYVLAGVHPATSAGPWSSGRLVRVPFVMWYDG